jgi:hypothetical protein
MSATRRLGRWLRAAEWPLVSLVAAAATVLGYIGFSQYAAAQGHAWTMLDRLYLALQLFPVQSGAVDGAVPWPLEVARFLAPAIALYTAIKAALSIFDEELAAARMARVRDHVVVCGLGQKGLRLARDFARSGERVIAIERESDAQSLDAAEQSGVSVVRGDATDPAILRRARAHKARLVAALCGRDGVNIQIAAQVETLRGQDPGRPVLSAVHVVDPTLCELLKHREILGGTAHHRTQYFNVYQLGAFALAQRFPPFADDGAPPPQVMIVGLGRLGERLLVHLAAAWAARAGAPGRLPVTVVDREAPARADRIARQYPHVADHCDVRPVAIDSTSAEFEDGSWLAVPGEPSGTPPYVYVCLGDETAALMATLRLKDRLEFRDIPIVVRVADESGLGRLFAGPSGTGRLAKVSAFPFLDAACSVEVVTTGTREILARAIHERYVREHRRRGTPDDASAVPWAELPGPLKESNRRQADHIGEKLAAIGCEIAPMHRHAIPPVQFSPAEVERLAIMEHERWVEERRGDGWTLSGTRDVAAKTSPYLVPWSQLPETVRDIDRDAARSLPSFLAQVGFAVRRESDGPAA